MSIVLKDITPLRPGATVIMLSRFNNMVRTGVMNDNYSILNAILTSYSKKYREMAEINKENYVNDLCDKMTNEITLDMWYKYIDSDTIKEIQKKIRDNIIKIYRFYSGSINDAKMTTSLLELYQKLITKNKIYFDNIFTILTLKKFDKDILKNLTVTEFENDANFKQQYTKYLSSYFLLTLNELPNIDSLKKQVRTKMETLFTEFISEIIQITENSIFQSYMNKFGTKNLNISFIPYFCDYFKRNIFFINSTTRNPYNHKHLITKYNKSIILLSIINTHHFESIGTIDHHHKVTREFKTNTELIQSIIEYINEGPSNAELFEDQHTSSISDLHVDTDIDADNSKDVLETPPQPPTAPKKKTKKRSRVISKKSKKSDDKEDDQDDDVQGDDQDDDVQGDDQDDDVQGDDQDDDQDDDVPGDDQEDDVPENDQKGDVNDVDDQDNELSGSKIYQSDDSDNEYTDESDEEN